MKRILLLLVLAAAPVHAEEPAATTNAKEDARRLFLAGKQAYQAGRVDLAAQSFEQAYRIEPAPGLLFNIAQAYRKQYVITPDPVLLKKSVDAYRRYLAEAPTGPNRALATEALSELAPLLARMATDRMSAAPAPAKPKTELMIVTETENASVRIDAQPAAPAPLLANVEPGPHRATVEAEGYFPAEVHLIAVEGRLVTGEARLTAKPGRVAVDGDRGATVALDGREIGRLPMPPVDTPAGRHVVTVVHRGRNSWVGEVQIDRDRSTVVHPDLTPTAQRRATPWLLGLTCASALVTVAAGAVWGQADAAASNLLGQYQTGQLNMQQLAEYQSDRDRRDAWRTGTYVAIGITGGLALITGALYMFDRQPPPRVVPRADLPAQRSGSAAY